MVFFMSLFSKISLLSTKKKNSSDQPRSKQSTSLFNFASSYSVYVLNIITNQGWFCNSQTRYHEFKLNFSYGLQYRFYFFSNFVNEN